MFGAKRSGKSNLVSRICFDHYTGTYEDTVGIDFSCKTIKRSNKNIKLQFWDLECSENNTEGFRNLITKGAIIILFVYSIVDALSFEYIEREIAIMEGKEFISPQTMKVIVGTKTDMRENQKVDPQRAQEFAISKNSLFVEVSAKDRSGIENLVSEMGSMIIQMVEAMESGKH